MNNGSSLLEKAIAIAVEAHRGQKDRCGAPYILHPLRVMNQVETEEEKTLAILHDVVEDTKWTFTDLKQAGFSETLLEALDCLTKREGELYDQLISRAAANPLARRVKLADLKDNLEATRLSGFTPDDAERFARYVAAWTRLIKIELAGR